LATKIIESESSTPLYHIFCINTSLNDYRFCWAVNEALQFNLTRMDDVSLTESLQSFSVYRDNETNQPLTYYLLSLKSGKGVLIKELASFDFLLCVEGQLSDSTLSTILAQASDIKDVLLVTKLDKNLIKPATIAELSYLIEMIG
jgi:hypothetical protein